jgi:hypothetical protein
VDEYMQTLWIPLRRSSTLLEAMMSNILGDFASRERLDSAKVYQHLPYLALKARYS